MGKVNYEMAVFVSENRTEAFYDDLGGKPQGRIFDLFQDPYLVCPQFDSGVVNERRKFL